MTVDGTWVRLPFLVDVAADRTVLCANVLDRLRLPLIAATDQLGGVGGLAASVIVETQVRFFREDDAEVFFRGQYAAITDPRSLDMSILGRDVTDFFAVIVDRPGDVVCLLGQRHRYVIVQQ